MNDAQFAKLRAMLKRLDDAEERLRLATGTVVDAFKTRFPQEAKTFALIEAEKERDAAKAELTSHYMVKR